MSGDELQRVIRSQLRSYRATLPDDRRILLERFEVIDVARKVVGVGSVGTRAFIALLQGRDEQDPLFLQVKEATKSVLEDHLPKSRYKQPGERVVQGQRMMQAASDIFLGWTKGEQENRYLYWRQLRDMKGSAMVETMKPLGMTALCRRRADGPSPVPTPGQATRSRSPLTWVRAISSTGRSPTSPNATPIRTNRIIRPLPTRFVPADWKRRTPFRPAVPPAIELNSAAPSSNECGYRLRHEVNGRAEAAGAGRPCRRSACRPVPPSWCCCAW